MAGVPGQLSSALGDRYRLERELGQGGMATVYLAHDLRHDRRVAIKVLHPELAHALGSERFLREISTTAQFDHPYILPLLDSGTLNLTLHDARPFYVMPYVEGESLRDRLTRQKQLPIEEALQVTREVAEALGYAHARGVIHRDIKPENILLSGGHARVVDFGIARAIDAAGSKRLTETGLAIGTPAYMSPEQSMAEREIDGRSDLYALGAVLYEMLAGEPPYTGPTAQAIIAKQMTNPVPSVRTLRETVPEHVDRALVSALARSPADRFATAAQFVEALSQSDTSLPAVVGPASDRKRAWVVGSGALLALTLFGGWLVVRSPPQVEPSAAVIAVLPFLPASADTALARLGRDLVLTISANLDGVGGIRTSDPRLVLDRADHSQGGSGPADAIALGKALGAGSVVVGNMSRVGTHIRVDLKLLSTGGEAEPLARASITGAPDSTTALTDSVTWALLRQVWRRGEPPSPSFASLTTRSVESLRAFLKGEQLAVAGRWPEAIEAYDAAFKADSTFWLAGWRSNWAQTWVLHGSVDQDLQRRIEAHRDALGEVDRLLVETDMPTDSLSEVELIARLHSITVRFPENWMASLRYADELHHWGPLVGVTNTEMRAALQRTVDLNPKLVPMWEHLFFASIGQDSGQAARAINALAALKGDDPDLRLILSANGPRLPVPLRDSVAGKLARSTNMVERFLGATTLLWLGYPAAQIELNQRVIALDPRGPLSGIAWEGIAYAWAARGAWDSVLGAGQRAVSLEDPWISPVSLYNVAVTGALLGGLDTARAAGQRAAAVKYLGRLPQSDFTEREKERQAWADGMLAWLRRDQRGMAEGGVRLHRSSASMSSGANAGSFMERSLAGFELELKGAKVAAAESLAALDLAATSAVGPHRDPYARSITHLEAARLLLEQGDSTRALKLLVWHEAFLPASPESPRTPIFTGLAYAELARIEEAQGRDALARDHYRQFLRRYDMPLAEHQHLVSEAQAALRRLASQDDAPARTSPEP